MLSKIITTCAHVRVWDVNTAAQATTAFIKEVSDADTRMISFSHGKGEVEDKMTSPGRRLIQLSKGHGYGGHGLYCGGRGKGRAVPPGQARAAHQQPTVSSIQLLTRSSQIKSQK